jgi:hypothetical protein
VKHARTNGYRDFNFVFVHILLAPPASTQDGQGIQEQSSFPRIVTNSRSDRNHVVSVHDMDGRDCCPPSTAPLRLLPSRRLVCPLQEIAV